MGSTVSLFGSEVCILQIENPSVYLDSSIHVVVGTWTWNVEYEGVVILAVEVFLILPALVGALAAERGTMAVSG